MNNEELKVIASNYMQIWSAGNADILDKYAHEHIVAHYTHFENSFRGTADYKSMLKMTYDFFPDL